MKRTAAVIFLTAVSVAAQEAPAVSALKSAIEQSVSQHLKDDHLPGAAIAIVEDDHVAWAKGFGVASVETNAPVTPDMLFRMGSTTKMFTAATLVSLAEEGRLDLNAPIGRYLKGVAPCLAKVTAHQLLTHTAGITDVAPMFGSHDDSALAANVLSWKDDYCFTEPGKIFSYANPGYVLAGYLAETIAGKPYADVVAEHIFQPLGMTHSTFRPTVAMTFSLAQGHDDKMQIVRPAADYAGAWPAGSMFSNVNDLARWVIALMHEGKLEGKQVLSRKLVAKLTTPYVDMPQDARYAYGLEITGAGDDLTWVHAGNRTGYGSLIEMSPRRGTAMIALGNRTGANFGGSGLEKRLPATSRKPRPSPVPGNYTNGRETVRVESADGTLTVIQDGKPITTYTIPPDADYLWVGSRAYKRVP
jgi:CubicO group peptidase (beta-lactamase class C family)